MSGIMDRLFPQDFRFGGAACAEAERQAAQIREELSGKLDPEGKNLLEKLSDAAMQSGSTEIRDAYATGFFDGMELMTEYFRRCRENGFSV